MINMVRKGWKICLHLAVVGSHLEMAVRGMGSTPGMQRTFLQNSLEVALLDLVHQDLGGLCGSSRMGRGILGDSVGAKISFDLIVRAACQRNHHLWRANCRAALRSSTLDQQGKWRFQGLWLMPMGICFFLSKTLVIFSSFNQSNCCLNEILETSAFIYLKWHNMVIVL
jgi:hypothetical protein